MRNSELLGLLSYFFVVPRWLFGSLGVGFPVWHLKQPSSMPVFRKIIHCQQVIDDGWSLLFPLLALAFSEMLGLKPETDEN
jgi:hypothetical protein